VHTSCKTGLHLTAHAGGDSLLLWVMSKRKAQEMKATQQTQSIAKPVKITKRKPAPARVNFSVMYGGKASI